MCREEKPLRVIWKTSGLNMLKRQLFQSERAERCLHKICEWDEKSYREFMQPFISYARNLIICMIKRDAFLSLREFGLKEAKFIAIEVFSYVLKSLSVLCKGRNCRCLTDLSHSFIFLFTSSVYFCTPAVLATHENTRAAEGTVHVPWVIFNKSLTRQFRNSQIHASNAIYSKDTNLSHLWCCKFDSCWIMCR